MLNEEELEGLDDCAEIAERLDAGYDVERDDLDSDDFMPDERLSNCSPWMRELDAAIRRELADDEFTD